MLGCRSTVDRLHAFSSRNKEVRHLAKIGFSLSVDFLLGEPADDAEQLLSCQYGGADRCLAGLRAKGVNWVELRTVACQDNADRVLAAAKHVWANGLSLSVHGRLQPFPAHKGFQKGYGSLAKIWTHLPREQDLPVILTIHAYAGKEGYAGNYARQTVDALRDWQLLIGQEVLPVRLALELNRRKGTIDPSTDYAGVLAMAEAAGPSVGLCWDMGHDAANRKLPEADHPMKPPAAFLSRVIHTHIHGLSSKGTHHPLQAGDEPVVGPFLAALRLASYTGIYNIELSFNRFAETISPRDGLEQSIEQLKHMLSSAERLGEVTRS